MRRGAGEQGGTDGDEGVAALVLELLPAGGGGPPGVSRASAGKRARCGAEWRAQHSRERSDHAKEMPASEGGSGHPGVAWLGTRQSKPAAGTELYVGPDVALVSAACAPDCAAERRLRAGAARSEERRVGKAGVYV